jgi:hypothetical protein
VQTLEVWASVSSAFATCVLAWAAWIQLPLISRQVESLSKQIEESRKADINAERRIREWETLKICQRYDFDPIIDAATERIYAASNDGKDYRLPGVKQRDMICILNYFDGIAIGIEQNLYIEDIVRDHLGPMFAHAVTNFLDTGLVPIAGLEKVQALNQRWSKPPGYRSTGTST